MPAEACPVSLCKLLDQELSKVAGPASDESGERHLSTYAPCAAVSHLYALLRTADDAACTSVPVVLGQTAGSLFGAHRLEPAVAQLCTARPAGWQQGDRVKSCYDGTRGTMLPSHRNGGSGDVRALLIDGNTRDRARQQMARNRSPVLLRSLAGLADLSLDLFGRGGLQGCPQRLDRHAVLHRVLEQR